MKLKYVELVLENCEVIKIDGKHIGIFLIDKIEKSISRVAVNAIMEMNIANKILLEIHSAANDVEYHPFNMEDETTAIFDRLCLFKDITQINFVLDSDGEEKYYHYITNWIGNDNCNNKAQISYLSDCGHMYIAIANKIASNKRNIYDYFGDVIDDKDEMDFHFKMMSIGDEDDEC